MKDFEGKVALISGASRGIGRAVAVELARRGAAVAVAYASNEAAGRETLERVEAAGGRGRLFKLEVSDAAACDRVVQTVIGELGRIDVLVNNAGIALDGLVMQTKDEAWDRQFEVNVKGAFHLSRAVSKPMLRQRSGAIVNVSSVVGEAGRAGQTAYSATKAALIGFTKSLARELASRDIRVNAVSPGFIETDMSARISGEARTKLLESIPLGRLGNCEEVARAVVFLASDQASYVTGEVLRVNGGLLT
jgi:3-oxoacyl-[acyl-carrier protein] reductase